MIISDYFKAFQQTNFTSTSQKMEVMRTFSDALVEYSGTHANDSDAALTNLNNFYFSLPAPDEKSDLSGDDMMAVSQVNDDVVAAEVSDLFKKNGISEAEAVTFKIDKYGQLAVEGHSKSQQILALLKSSGLDGRIRSALSDASTAANEVHQDYIDALIGSYTGHVRAALIKERDRSVPPHAELTMQNGKIAATYGGNSLDGWMNVYKGLLANLITAQEAEDLKFLLDRTT